MSTEYCIYNHLLTPLLRRKTQLTPEMFDFRAKFLEGHGSLHSRCWSDVKNGYAENGYLQGGRKMWGLLNRGFSDLLENPILFFFHGRRPANSVPLVERASDLIDELELEIGGQRIDKIFGLQIDIMLRLYGLRILHGETFVAVPLPFDLFIGRNSFPIRDCHLFEVRICLMTKSTIPSDLFTDVRVRSDRVSLDTPFRPPSFLETLAGYWKGISCLAPTPTPGPASKPVHTLAFRQSQYTGQEMIGTRTQIQLFFNHPVMYLTFHFTDPTGKMVTESVFKKVRLRFDDRVFREEGIESVVHDTTERLGAGFDGVYLFEVSRHKIQEYAPDTVHFSEIDRVYLEFDFEPQQPSPETCIHVHAVSQNRAIVGGGIVKILPN